MANVCTFELHLRGSRPGVLALVEELQGVYDVTEQSWQGSDEDGVSYLRGECRWSVETSMIDTQRPLGLLAEEHGVELEIFGYDLSAPETFEHYHYRSGDCLTYVGEGATAQGQASAGAWWDEEAQTVRCVFRLTMDAVGGTEVAGDYDPFLDDFAAMMSDAVEVEDLKREREILIGLLAEHPVELLSLALNGEKGAYGSHEAVADELLELWWETNGMEIMDWAGPYNGDVARFTAFAREQIAEMVESARAALEADRRFADLTARAMELSADQRQEIARESIAPVLAAAVRFMGGESYGASFAGDLFIHAIRRALTGASGVTPEQQEEVLGWFDGLLQQELRGKGADLFRGEILTMKKQAQDICCLSHICGEVTDLVCTFALMVCAACGNAAGIKAVNSLRETRPY